MCPCGPHSRSLPIVLIAVAACHRPAAPHTPEPAPVSSAGPVLCVNAAYPGANAQVVADTVASPIEQQVNGAEGMAALESECRDDGTYRLTIRFKPGTDAEAAIVLVQNRLSLAEGALPEVVRRQGLTLRRGDPDRFPALWVAVTSPDGTYDAMFLNNYAELRVKDELARVPGVAEIRNVSRSEIAVRVWPDAEKLAARQLTIKDVVEAVGSQNIRLEAGQPGRDPAGKATPLIFTYLGRLPNIDQFDKTILRATADGKIIYLRDVARVELVAKNDGITRSGGKPSALLALRVDAGNFATDDLRKKLAELGKTNPKGLATVVAADLSGDRFAAIELRLPAPATSERTQEVVARVEKLLRGLSGTTECLAFGDREPNAATILVKLPAKDGPTPADLRKSLADIREASVRVSDLSSGRPFPVRVAILDKGGHGQEKLRAAADAVVKRLAKDGLALDHAVTPTPSSPRLSIHLDQKKLAELGLTVRGVTDSLDAMLGESVIADPSQDVGVLMAKRNEGYRGGAAALKTVVLKTPDGKLVPLTSVAEIRIDHRSETAMLRVNLHPAVVVTADVPSGKTVAEVTAECLKAAKEVVPREFEVIDPSASKPR